MEDQEKSSEWEPKDALVTACHLELGLGDRLMVALGRPVTVTVEVSTEFVVGRVRTSPTKVCVYPFVADGRPMGAWHGAPPAVAPPTPSWWSRTWDWLRHLVWLPSPFVEAGDVREE